MSRWEPGEGGRGFEVRITRGDHVFIRTDTKHRLTNISDEPLKVIEVQIADNPRCFVSEDDIKRFEDDFGRV